jgi:uncharacterized protein YjiS (DUF1127 family)
MTYISTDTRSGFLGNIRSRVDALRAVRAEAAAKRALYRRTVRELAMLSDRDLADIGISRLSIEDLAREHAYGK